MFLKTIFSGALCTTIMVMLGLTTVCEAVSVRLQNGSGFFAGVYNGTEDAFMRQAYPDAATGKYSEIQLGYESYNNGGKLRSMIRFNLGELGGSIRPATSISSAKLSFSVVMVAGVSITGKTLLLHRVSDANKGWSAGTSVNRINPEVGAVCWNWRAFDETNFAPDDRVNCPNPTAGCPRRYPWAGDVPVYTSKWPNLSTFSGSACGIAPTDYAATPIASTTISTGATEVVFVINNPSFLLSWMNNPAGNEGFVISCPDLENGNVNSYTTIRLASSDFGTVTSRPVLEINLDPFVAPLGGVSYSLPTAGKVSMHISNSTGKVVKELLFAANRNVGLNTEFWDCKDDPMPQKTDVPSVVPDGEYTVKMLRTPGLSEEYLMSVGTSGTAFDKFPGNHVTPGGISVDNSGMYISAGLNETQCGVRKQTVDGTAIFISPDLGGFAGMMATTLIADTLYGISNGGQFASYSAKVRSSAKLIKNLSAAGFQGGWGWDLSARGGHMIVGNSVSNSIAWITPATGAVIGSVISVPNMKGVTVDPQGNALVISGTSILKYTFGNSTPTTVVSTNLTLPNHLDVNPVNGDMYVLEYSTMQVKIFSSAGVLKRPLGRSGGRGKNGYGAYDPTQGFYHGTSIVTPDICVAADGSFYIAEQQPLRRVAHYDSLGTFVKEWYCGNVYAPHTAVDPDDPRIVWIGFNYDEVMRCQIDYVAKSWKVLGVYRVDKGLFNFDVGMGLPWSVVKRGGKTYLVQAWFPAVAYFDEVGDSLKFVAAAGYNRDSAGVMKVGGGGFQGSWADLNGDGQWQANEAIATTSTSGGFATNCCSQIHGINAIDSNFVCYGNMMSGGSQNPGTSPLSNDIIPGPARFAPKELRIVGGATVPVYDLKDLSYPCASNASQITAGMIHYEQKSGGSIDGKGNVYSAYPIFAEKFWADTTHWYKSSWIGGITLVKGNLQTGKMEWAVGRYSPANASPPAGSFGSLDHMLGTFRNCVGIADYYPNQYVYNEDGLYVGRFADTRIPYNGTALPSDLICGEQFGGMAIEVKRTDIPGLTKGDVLFFGGSDNSVPIMRIKGFDGFYRMSTTITVAGGKVIGQGPVVVVDSSSVGVAVPARDPVASASFNVNGGTKMQISYSIPSASPVTIELYSVLGHKVATLVDGYKQAGSYTVSVDQSKLKQFVLSSGFYVVSMKSSMTSATKKICLMR